MVVHMRTVMVTPGAEVTCVRLVLSPFQQLDRESADTVGSPGKQSFSFSFLFSFFIYFNNNHIEIDLDIADLGKLTTDDNLGDLDLPELARNICYIQGVAKRNAWGRILCTYCGVQYNKETKKKLEILKGKFVGKSKPARHMSC